MFVKLRKGISGERKNIITNGIRQHFKDYQTILVDIADIDEGLKAIMFMFYVFVVFIGVIALTLAFFLLSVSTTQSIRENEQEYGCLRAIGITKK